MTLVSEIAMMAAKIEYVLMSVAELKSPSWDDIAINGLSGVLSACRMQFISVKWEKQTSQDDARINRKFRDGAFLIGSEGLVRSDCLDCSVAKNAASHRRSEIAHCSLYSDSFASEDLSNKYLSNHANNSASAS
jgi:hypothetical protein